MTSIYAKYSWRHYIYGTHDVNTCTVLMLHAQYSWRHHMLSAHDVIIYTILMTSLHAQYSLRHHMLSTHDVIMYTILMTSLHAQYSWRHIYIHMYIYTQYSWRHYIHTTHDVIIHTVLMTSLYTRYSWRHYIHNTHSWRRGEQSVPYQAPDRCQDYRWRHDDVIIYTVLMASLYTQYSWRHYIHNTHSWRRGEQSVPDEAPHRCQRYRWRWPCHYTVRAECGSTASSPLSDSMCRHLLCLSWPHPALALYEVWVDHVTGSQRSQPRSRWQSVWHCCWISRWQSVWHCCWIVVPCLLADLKW